jgi:CYTH domain-containing protein
MPIENERKYLLDIAPSIFRNRLTNLEVNHSVEKIQQTYIAQDRVRGYIERVRSIQYSDDRLEYILTQKVGFSPDVREIETIITRDKYEEFLDFFAIGNTIMKTRYVIPMDNKTKWEIDVFSGAYAGVIVAEMELPTPDTEIVFHPVLGKEENLVEVSNDVKYKNWYMADI